MNQAPTDIELLERVRNSDADAYGELFRRYQPVVFRQVFFRVRESDMAHEIVQETFVRIWDHRAALKPHLPFLALTLRIVQNLIRDAARHTATRERLSVEVPPPALSERDDPSEALAVVMLDQRIRKAIENQLGERCRTVFLLSRYEGKTHQEISDVLGISVKTVENQLTKALKVLRKALKD
jgi:RNA polymerase sigma-70 factor, ECF subfamily